MSFQKDLKTSKSDLQTVATLTSAAISQCAKLFQNEVDLAKAEVGEKFSKIGGAITFIGVGAILVIPALVMALFALAAAMIKGGWSEPISYFVAAVVPTAIAGILFMVGLKRLDTSNIAPRETLRQLEKDKDTFKGMVR
jgi:Putative Actinobacterial Holin-X, holin superfamily III